MEGVVMMPGIARLEFTMGAHGLVWKTGTTEVERVSCQARLLGVKPGWSISTINGVPIEQGHQAWTELMKCKKAGKKYPVYFAKDEASIRADQAKAEMEKQKKAKDTEERKKREEAERKIREDAEKKRQDGVAAQKQAYWDKQEEKKAAEAAAGAGAAAPAAEGEAAPAEGGDAPAEGGDAPAGEGEAPAEGEEAPAAEGEAPAEGGEAPAEEAPAAE